MKHVDTPQTRCKAGFARGDITPPVGIYHRMWGAAVHERATGIHRPLLATALWLQPRNEGAEKGQCVLAIDHCIVDGEDMQRIRQTVGRAVGIDSEQVQVALSHTHGSGWMSRSRAHFPGGDLIAPYLDEVCEKLTQLAIEAKQTSQDATIVYGQGKCNLARHRDLWDAEHRKFVVGFNPDGHADEMLLVARVNNSQGVTLGTIVNYACHPTTLAWQNTSISPDYIGAMREVIEGATKAPCVFLRGGIRRSWTA
jgi:hypothetical protein